MRNLTLPEIQARFDRHAKLHRFEVDKLCFGCNSSKHRYTKCQLHYKRDEVK